MGRLGRLPFEFRTQAAAENHGAYGKEGYQEKEDKHGAILRPLGVFRGGDTRGQGVDMIGQGLHLGGEDVQRPLGSIPGQLILGGGAAWGLPLQDCRGLPPAEISRLVIWRQCFALGYSFCTRRAVAWWFS